MVIINHICRLICATHKRRHLSHSTTLPKIPVHYCKREALCNELTEALSQLAVKIILDFKINPKSQKSFKHFVLFHIILIGLQCFVVPRCQTTKHSLTASLCPRKTVQKNMKTDDEECVGLQAMQTLPSHFDNLDVKLDKLIIQIRRNSSMELQHN